MIPRAVNVNIDTYKYIKEKSDQLHLVFTYNTGSKRYLWFRASYRNNHIIRNAVGY